VSTPHRYAPPVQAVLKTQTYNALFNETLVASYFPDVHIFYILGASTTWFCMWAYMETSRLYKEAIKQKNAARTTSFCLVEEANHFVSVLNPSLFFRFEIGFIYSYTMISQNCCYSAFSKVAVASLRYENCSPISKARLRIVGTPNFWEL
jgi:hypothetical protein